MLEHKTDNFFQWPPIRRTLPPPQTGFARTTLGAVTRCIRLYNRLYIIIGYTQASEWVELECTCLSIQYQCVCCICVHRGRSTHPGSIVHLSDNPVDVNRVSIFLIHDLLFLPISTIESAVGKRFITHCCVSRLACSRLSGHIEPHLPRLQAWNQHNYDAHVSHRPCCYYHIAHACYIAYWSLRCTGKKGWYTNRAIGHWPVGPCEYSKDI